MGDQINVFLDNLDALLLRLLHFPIVFQLLFWLIISTLFWLFLLYMLRKKVSRLKGPGRFVIAAVCILCSFLIAGSVILDRKWSLERQESAFMNLPQIEVESNASGQCFDLVSAMDTIRVTGHADTIRTRLIYMNEGIQAVAFELMEHPVFACIARVDLTRYDVILDTAIKEKEKPSDFAKRYDAEIVVNGEAGISPGLTAPLGGWTGNYVVNGQVLKMADTDRRPFLSFNRYSKARYSPDREVVKELQEDMYNVIWGRFDLILDGKIGIDERDMTKSNPYPRTIVGIDSTGLQLFLLVVDGRRPAYSVGLTMEECAQVLLPLGVYNAMACDQGGSSCMYIKELGIVNRPADGVERAVYTHLGFRSRY